MRKFIAVVGMVAVLGLTPGCAAIQKLAGPLVPKVEAKLDENGVGIDVGANLGIDSFCLNEDGTVANFLTGLPSVLGKLGESIVNGIGTCAVEDETNSEE
jgi:hypothetical protein